PCHQLPDMSRTPVCSHRAGTPLRPILVEEDQGAGQESLCHLWCECPAYPPKKAGGTAHAAQAGMMGDLVADPLYLVAAEPNRLLRALAARGHDLPPEIIQVYQ